MREILVFVLLVHRVAIDRLAGKYSPVLFPGLPRWATAAWKLRIDLLEATFRTALAAFTGLSISVIVGTLSAFVFLSQR